MYNAVGIDVSKGKSTVAVLQPGGTVIRKPFDVSHTSQNLNELADYLSSLDGTTKIVMECTGRYHEPMIKALSEAGLFISIVNPHLIKNFGNNSLRKVKSDPADARKIARYTLDNWTELRQYSCMDNTRTQLKTLNSQFSFFMKQKVAAKANLLDEKGNLPRAGRALMADAIGTVSGAMLGTSTVTSYVESSAGVAEGGKTGLTAVVTGLLFLVSLFLSPIFLASPSFATAPALIIVGLLMMSAVTKMSFEGDFADTVGGFLAIVMMPFTYSIANGPARSRRSRSPAWR